MLPRLVSWFIFSLIIGLSPLMSNYLALLNRNIEVSLETLVGQGELFIFVAAISAGSIGELLASKSVYKVLNILSGGASTVILYLSASQYSDISSVLQILDTTPASQQSNMIALDPKRIVESSLIFLMYGVIASACCIGISTIGNKGQTVNY